MSFILLFVLFNKPLYAEAETSSNSTANESSKSIFWPLEFFLNAAIYPISAPLRYAFDNGVIESSMELITFGERNNVIIYPTLNLKPGNTTQLGFTYRHRSLFFKKDY